MLLVIIILAFTVPFYHEDIKGINNYSYYIQRPEIKYILKHNEKNTQYDELVYKPHISGFSGISASNKNLTLALAFQNEDENNKNIEESDLFDIQLSGVRKNYLWEIYYQNYQGIYINDKDEDINETNLPRANSYSYGLGFKKFTRDNYTLEKSLASYSKQKQTNWSYLWGSFLNQSKIYSNSTLIPQEYEASFNQLKGLTSLKSSNLGFEVGISGMYTYKGLYISSLITTGMTFQKQEFSGLDTKQRALTTRNTSLTLDFGHDWKHSAIGVNSITQTIFAPIKNAEFEQSRLQIMFYYKYFF